MLRLFLTISLVAAIIFAIVVGIISLTMINRFRQQTLQNDATNSYQNALNNPQNGELLFNLKKNAVNPLDDLQLTYAINTIIRNQYQVSCTFNFSDNYETENLIVLARQQINCQNFDFLLINFNENILTQISEKMPLLNEKGIIMICNVPRKNNVKKAILTFCNDYKYRFSYEKIGKGIILIAK